jgi:fimbrial chaperone protein
MSPFSRRIASTTLLLAFLLPLASEAGVFSVTPVRLFMTVRERAIAVTLTNDGDSDVVLQADINTWTQAPDGTDQLVPTEDLILAPPIIKLAPKARQVVRLAFLKPPDLTRQLTYRIIVREVPEALPQGPGLQVPIALALSMPVFVTPPNAKKAVSCAPARDAAGAVSLRCSNGGSAYAQLREATLTRGDKVVARFEGGTYILPGAAKPIALKGDGPVGPGDAKLDLLFDDGQNVSSMIALP